MNAIGRRPFTFNWAIFMGLFDTYCVAWGDGAEDIQTKQFEQSMSTWKIGDRPPLNELEEEPLALGRVANLPASASEFCCVIEDTNLAHRWASPISLRHFALGHHQGFFADYLAAFDDQGARERGRALCELWESSDLGGGLRRRLSLLRERNARAELSLAQSQAYILPSAAAWAAEQERVRGKTPEQVESMNKAEFFGGFQRLRLVDFEGVGEISIHQAFEELTSSWALDGLDFETALTPSTPAGAPQRLALDVAGKARGWGWGRHPGPELGAESIAALDELASPPSSRDANPLRTLAYLRSGHWSRFEAEAESLLDDKIFVEQARSDMGRLCLSRLGGFWAAGAMARLPALAPSSIQVGSESTPLVDWLVSALGLPSRLVAPLLEQGARCSPQLIYAALLPAHAALFPALAGVPGGLRSVPPLDSGGLAVQAARAASVQALSALGMEGLLSPLSEEAREAAREAFDAESRSADSGAALNLARLPDELRCAGLMCEAGHRPTAPSPRLAAWLARAERGHLAAATPEAETPSASAPRIRL